MPANSTLCLSWVPRVPWVLKCIRCLYFKIGATRTSGAASIIYRPPILSLRCEWGRNGLERLSSVSDGTQVLCVKLKLKAQRYPFMVFPNSQAQDPRGLKDVTTDS